MISPWQLPWRTPPFKQRQAQTPPPAALPSRFPVRHLSEQLRKPARESTTRVGPILKPPRRSRCGGCKTMTYGTCDICHSSICDSHTATCLSCRGQLCPACAPQGHSCFGDWVTESDCLALPAHANFYDFAAPTSTVEHLQEWMQCDNGLDDDSIPFGVLCGPKPAFVTYEIFVQGGADVITTFAPADVRFWKVNRLHRQHPQQAAVFDA